MLNDAANLCLLSGWLPDQYQLLDFGCSRKLERFGPVILDRGCPAAEQVPMRDPDAWAAADIALDSQGTAVADSQLLGSLSRGGWRIRFAKLSLLLKLTPFGHVGLFPEQAANWLWLRQQVLDRVRVAGVVNALNLFAYTGAATLMMAGAGAEVVHVDASAPAVAWARTNAELSQLQRAPIRWIVEDARKFVARELRRGRRYDLIVLDPPSYGHGPNGQRWEILRDLRPLLKQCGSLLREDCKSQLLLTAHSDEPNEHSVAEMLSRQREGEIAAGRLQLADLAARPLDAGYYVRATYASY